MPLVNSGNNLSPPAAAKDYFEADVFFLFLLR
jgi:hypothetical protein